jgi:hypothetical protein
MNDLATWALVFVTGALVVATVVLAVFARNAAHQATRQADLTKDSLEVSRRLLDAAEAERAAAAPLELSVDLNDSGAGNVILDIRNASADAVMRLTHVEVVESASGTVIEDQTLAEGTIGVGAGWQVPITWDASRVGITIIVRATGHRLGGLDMTREFAFRVGQDGSLEDLAGAPVGIYFGNAR